MIKIVLITFMTIAALSAFKEENLHPFIPPEYGWPGVLQAPNKSNEIQT